MKSKWEWITEKLEELGLVDLAAKAREIETILKRLYGDTITEFWEENFDNIESEYRTQETLENKLKIIFDIARNANYCVACIEHHVCSTCEFGKIAGICTEENSMFADFIEL